LIYVTLLALISAAIMGYHPYAEDAGIYLSGLHLALNPALYPSSQPFILAHMHHTLFPYFLAMLVRILHLPVQWTLLAVHFALLWLLVFALQRLAIRCWPRPVVQWAAVAVAAFCFATPVAGTALCIADPYLTPRSFATPLAILLFSAVLDVSFGPAILLLTIAFLFHPLMALYAGLFALVLWTIRTRRTHGTLRICLATVAAAIVIALSQQHVVESPAYIRAALTRTYFFMEEWQWYEIVGLIAPLAVFLWMFRADTAQTSPQARNRSALSGASAACAITAITISSLLVHPDSHSHLLARLQPLRTFHTLYLLMFLLLAGTLVDLLLRTLPLRPAVTCIATMLAILGFSMFYVERQVFPACVHFEIPGHTPQNPWEQAFLWSHDHTPQDAVFALDANYITTSGEDAQNFRSLAERSALSDYSKDGGSSAIFPQLAPRWQQDEPLTVDLSRIPDSERIARLSGAHVSWVVLQQKFQTGAAQTHFACPYRNATVLVCRLPLP
jgi:hypothetical protein